MSAMSASMQIRFAGHPPASLLEAASDIRRELLRLRERKSPTYDLCRRTSAGAFRRGLCELLTISLPGCTPRGDRALRLLKRPADGLIPSGSPVAPAASRPARSTLGARAAWAMVRE